MVFSRLPQQLLTVLSLSSCCIFAIGLIFTWTNRTGIISPTGVPMGADLLQHHVAARFAAEGNWAALYQDSHLGRILYERSHPGKTHPVRGFDYVYPPLVAWVGSPFSQASYPAWVAAWQIAILVFYAASHRLLAPWRPPLHTNWIVALGLPVFYYGVILAQNSSLSLLVACSAAILLARNRPWLAGFVLSCLFYKPQIGLAVAGFLFLTGQWRCAFAFGFGSLLSLSLGALLCGPQTTLAWFGVLQRMLGGAQNQVAELHQSLPGAVKTLLGRDAHPSLPALASLTGMVLYAATALAAGLAARRQGRPPECLLFLALAAWTLFSPYVMHYDLLLALPWWWWNLQQDLGSSTPKKTRIIGLLAASAFWLASLLSINPANLPLTPALPFLVFWFFWTLYRFFLPPAPAAAS